MMASLKRNFWYKALSAVIAVLLYYIAYGQQNPRIPREIFVAPEVVGVPDNLVVKEPPRGASITVTGYAATINSLRPQSVRATVDATNARAGFNRLPITYVLPTGVRADMGMEARFAEVTFEKEEQIDFGVEVLFSGTAPVGYSYAEPITQPRMVEVSGTLAEVKRVGRVVARVEKGDDEGAITRTVPLIAQDADYRLIEGVRLEPAQVLVKIGLKRLPATKNMLLSARFEGEPAPGYRIHTYSFTPATVTVAGTPEELSSRSSIEVPVDVSGLSRTVNKAVTIIAPAGLRLQDAPEASVRLEVRAIDAPVGRPSATPSPVVSPSPAAVERPPSPSPAPAESPTPRPESTE